MLHLLAPANELALRIDHEQRLAQRAIRMLKRVKQKLEKSGWDSDYKVCPRIHWWEKMHYAQIDSKNRPSYWIGYHVARKYLMYGHGRSERCPEIAAKFAAALSPVFSSTTVRSRKRRMTIWSRQSEHHFACLNK
jgi:hypothetical protein